MATKEVTVREIFEAIKLNGFEHLRGQWTNIDDGKVGACLLGQAALNIGSVGPSIQSALNKFMIKHEDIPRLMKPDYVETDINWETGETVEIKNESYLGGLLVEMNDAVRKNGYVYRYSWKTLVREAEILMTPYFEETVYVEEYKWEY